LIFCPGFFVAWRQGITENQGRYLMKKTLFAVALSLLYLFFVAGCGSGSGESSIYQGANGTTSDTSLGGLVSLAWEAPVGSDGMPLANVAGYMVYYGTSSGSYDNKVDNGTLSSSTIRGLAPGTYYIAVTCYDLAGTESTFSNEVSSTVQ
jgi:hypothetical protein